MKNNFLFLIAVCSLALIVPGCKKSDSMLGQVLFKASGNPVFKEIEPDTLASVLRTALKERQRELSYPELITGFYRQHNHRPVLLQEHIPEKDIETVLEYCRKAKEHGLDPALFRPGELSALLDTILAKKGISSAGDAYRRIAELELLLANSLATYANALQYGVSDPREIYERYYIETKRPDSLSMAKLFRAKDLETYLDSIQPGGKAYKALQRALMSGIKATGRSQEETAAILKVNLERLRWKNRPAESKYVLVNIADFRLHVIEEGKSVLDMKVCVGEGRDTDDSSKKDRPGRWETPQLDSRIHSVQVNPVWNIPESIASREIIKHAAADPYYLDNSNIDVYKHGQKIADTRHINWGAVSKENMPYTFKQRPGEQNALGRIKFLFENKSNIYLHDTPAKAAFKRPMRATSHGCVRVEKPLELARALFGNSGEYELIKKEMNLNKPDAKNIRLPEKVPVYLTYYTCWMDEEHVLQFRPDVYGLDQVLFNYLQEPVW